MSNYFNKNINEGLFNPKTVGTDMRVTQGLSPLGQEYGLGAIQAQRQALAGYQGIANGTSPSLAQMQWEQAQAANNRAALGLMGSARGGNIAGAYATALGAQQGANAQSAQQGAMLRAQEQQMAYGNMAALGGQMAGQQFGYDQLNQNVQLGLRGQDLNYNLGKRGLDMQADQNAFNNAFQLGMAGANAAGSLFTGISNMGGVDDQQMSDPRVKTGLGPASVADQAAQVGGRSYQYQPGLGQPQGQQYGVDAAQLANTTLGPTLVQQGPDGLLRVDGARAGIAGLAASGEIRRDQANQEQRILALEARLAQQDPYASPEMRTMGQDYERAQEGPYRTSFQQRQQVANQREAMRGLGMVRAATPPDAFAGAPQMQRASATADADPQYAAIVSQPGRYSSPEFVQTIDPFGPEPVEREGLGPRRGKGRRRRRETLGPAEQGGEMQATPVSFGNTPTRPTEPAIYRGGASARPIPIEMRPPPKLDPASQQMLDGAHDYLNEYTTLVQDENGNVRRVLIPEYMRNSMAAPTPIELQRQMDQLAIDDAIRAREEERARMARQPEGMMF